MLIVLVWSILRVTEIPYKWALAIPRMARAFLDLPGSILSSHNIGANSSTQEGLSRRERCCGIKADMTKPPNISGRNSKGHIMI